MWAGLLSLAADLQVCMPWPVQMELILSGLCTLPRLSAYRRAQENTCVLAKRDGQAMDRTAQPSTTACCPLWLGATRMLPASMLGQARYVPSHSFPPSTPVLWQFCSASIFHPSLVHPQVLPSLIATNPIPHRAASCCSSPCAHYVLSLQQEILLSKHARCHL